MPAAWIGLGLGAMQMFGGGSGGGGGSSNITPYTPTGLGAADQNWQQMMQANQGQLGYQGQGGMPMGGLASGGGYGGWQGGQMSPQMQGGGNQQQGPSTTMPYQPQQGMGMPLQQQSYGGDAQYASPAGQ